LKFVSQTRENEMQRDAKTASGFSDGIRLMRDGETVSIKERILANQSARCSSVTAGRRLQ
jgi:hypothetical protein